MRTHIRLLVGIALVGAALGVSVAAEAPLVLEIKDYATAPSSAVPDGTSVPGLTLAGYTPTPPIATPGSIEREAIVIEWTDTNVSNATFEGTARELMRLQLNTRIHPMGDLIFNPTARPGDPDWRVLYIGCGDGGSGERRTAMRQNPQRLDTLVGKILRIVPDLSRHTDTRKGTA